MNDETLLPIQYRIEFYEGARESASIVHTVCSSTPPFPISVGDKVDQQPWENSDLSLDKIYKVVEITHLIWTVDSSYVYQNLSIAVTPVDREA